VLNIWLRPGSTVVEHATPILYIKGSTPATDEMVKKLTGYPAEVLELLPGKAGHVGPQAEPYNVGSAIDAGIRIIRHWFAYSCNFFDISERSSCPE
jgi:hypothetical protein